jgi:hypothetical protein
LRKLVILFFSLFFALIFSTFTSHLQTQYYKREPSFNDIYIPSKLVIHYGEDIFATPSIYGQEVTYSKDSILAYDVKLKPLWRLLPIKINDHFIKIIALNASSGTFEWSTTCNSDDFLKISKEEAMDKALNYLFNLNVHYLLKDPIFVLFNNEQYWAFPLSLENGSSTTLYISYSHILLSRDVEYILKKKEIPIGGYYLIGDGGLIPSNTTENKPSLPLPLSKTIGASYATSVWLTKVPFYFQEELKWCAIASAQMILQYWGRENISQTEIANQFGGAPNGLTIDQIEQIFANYEYQFHWHGSMKKITEENPPYVNDIKYCIYAGLPVIVTQWTSLNHEGGHARVVVGFDDSRQTVRLHDPGGWYGWSYDAEVSYSLFEELWDWNYDIWGHDHGGVVAYPGDWKYPSASVSLSGLPSNLLYQNTYTLQLSLTCGGDDRGSSRYSWAQGIFLRLNGGELVSADKGGFKSFQAYDEQGNTIPVLGAKIIEFYTDYALPPDSTIYAYVTIKATSWPQLTVYYRGWITDEDDIVHCGIHTHYIDDDRPELLNFFNAEPAYIRDPSDVYNDRKNFLDYPTYSITCNVIDNTPPSNPTSYSSNPSANVWSNDNTVDITWYGASDDLSGINGYWYRWTKDTYGDPTGYSYTTGISITSLLSDGIWYLNIRSRDNAGNDASGYVYCGPFKIDTTPPSTPSPSGPYGWTNDNTPHITWNAVSDSGSGVAGYEYAIDQTTSWTNLGNVLGFDTPPLSDGSHVIYVRTKDNAGNPSSPGSFTVYIDTTPPAGIITINGGATYTNSPSVTLTLSAVDGKGSGVAYMCFSNDGSSWSSWEPYATSKQWTLTPGDGIKTVYVKFKDYVGLESSPSSDTITLDTTPPSTPTLSSPTDGFRVNPKPTFVWTASSDSTSGVASYILEVDTSVSFDSSNLRRYEVTTTSYQIPQNLSLGTWYWRVRARDNAGNLGSFSTVNKIIVDRIKITDGGVSNSRLDVGAHVTVWFKAVYESDNLIFDSSKGTLYIDGKAAQWSSLNSRWELSESQTTVQKKSYTVTGVSDIYGLTNINDVVGPQEVIWDRIKIIGYEVSDDRVNVNSTQFVFVSAVYEYDNVPFTTGVLKINGTDAYYNTSIKKWVLPYSSSKVSKIVFKVSSVNDSMYNLTTFYDSNLPPAIVWDRVKIDRYGTVSERVNVNTSCLIYFVLKYEYDDSLVNDGVVILNGSLSMTWNYTSNRWELKDSLSSVGKKTYYISSIKNNKYNITALEQGASAKSAYVIWDRIKITSYEVLNKRADVGSNQKVFVSAVYEYDSKPFVNGQLYVNGSLATYNSSINKWVAEVNSSNIGRFIYKVSSAHYGDLSLVYDNLTPPSIIWDRIKIYDGGVSSALVNTGEKQVIWFKAVYEYDGVPFNQTTCALYVNGTKAVWNSTSGRWEITYVSDMPRALVFSVSSVNDAIYGLTAFISEVKPKIVWTELWMANLTIAPSFLVNVNTTVNISVQVVWAHNGSTVPGALVNFSLGRQAWATKTNSSGWASFNVSKDVIGSYSFNLTALEDPSGRITKCKVKTGEVTWTALKVVNASYDKPITNVGTPIRIQLRVLWAHNDSASVGALVEVNGTLFTATTNETGWVSFNLTYNDISTHRFEVKAIKDYTGYVTACVGSYSPQLTWTGLNVTDLISTKDFLSIGENTTFYVKLMWAHNRSVVVGGLVNISGSIGITNSSGWAVVNVTKLIGGVYEVKAIPLRDSMGWVTMPLKIVSHNVTWTGLRILNVLWKPSNVINIGENLTIYAQLAYAHNNSPIAMGIIAFNNTQLETNGTGWVSYKLSYSNPTSITVSIWGIKDAAGAITAHEAPKNCSLTWTALVLNLIAEKSLANTGENVTVYASLRWAHNSSSIKAGIISLNGTEKETNETGWARWTFSYDVPNTYLFKAVAIRDPTGYVTVGMPGSLNITVTWTELRISSYTISKRYVNINDIVTITGTLVWAHNGTPVIGGVMSLGNTISYTNKSGVAMFNVSQAIAGEYKYVMSPVKDSTGHITKGNPIQLPSITWTALRIDRMIWDKDLVNIGDVVKIYAHLAYAHNLTSIAGGSIALNGTIAITNSTGWAMFNVSVNSPSSYVYLVKGLKDGIGWITVADNNQSHRFAWTAINVSYIASNTTLSEVNKTVEITAKIVWAHNGSAIPGALVTLVGNSTMLQAYTNDSGYARFNITTSKVGEYFFNVTGKEAYGINKTLESKSTSIRFGIKCYITLNLRKGYNLIALPLLNESLTASSLLNLVGNVSQSVFMFNASSQTWVSYDKKLVEFGIPQPNFKIEPNVGYFVYVNNDTNVTFVGIRNDFKRIIPLRKGYNLIGWTYLNRSTVLEKFINYSSSIDSVFMFNETIQRYVSYDKKVAEFGVEQPNFEILPGHAYFVYANKDDYLYYGGEI